MFACRTALSAEFRFCAFPGTRTVGAVLLVGFITYPAFASLGSSSLFQALNWRGDKVLSPIGELHTTAPSKKNRGRAGAARLDGMAFHPKLLVGEVRFAKVPIAPQTGRFSVGGKGYAPRGQAGGAASASAKTTAPLHHLSAEQLSDTARNLSLGVEPLRPSAGESNKEKQQRDSRTSVEPTRFSAETDFSAKMEYKNFGVGDGKPNGGFLGFVLPAQRWELNDVKEARMEFSTRDEWVKLSLRESELTYQADTAYLLSTAGSNPLGNYIQDKFAQSKTRFLFNNQPIGDAGLERIDVKFIDSGLMKLTAFAFHSQTDDAFYSDLARRNSKRRFCRL